VLKEWRPGKPDLLQIELLRTKNLNRRSLLTVISYVNIFTCRLTSVQEIKMRFGFHISIAGGFSKVIERAKVRGCETIQFFSRNPRGWRYAPLDKNEVGHFRSLVKPSALFPLFLHLPYLPNLASPDSNYRKRSIGSIVTDLKRAEQIGAPYLIIHIGHRMEASEDQALETVSQGIDQAFERAKNSVTLLLENTAGQGTEIGYHFEHLRRILDGVHDRGRMGICLDTAHAFEAGYDLSRKEGIEQALESFDQTVGLKRLRLLHLNDSKTPLGSRKDRHWHIGEGYIGKEGFRQLINHSSIRTLPGIMETPRKDTVEDLKNMRVIRSLME
jgi:deoxyribonuclease-4